MSAGLRKGQLLAVAALALLAACARKPTRAECAAMLGRYVEMTADQDRSLVGLTGPQAAEVRAQLVAQKRAAPEFARAEEQCTREVSRAELECAMGAKTPNDWEACIE